MKLEGNLRYLKNTERERERETGRDKRQNEKEGLEHDVAICDIP